MVYKKQLSCVLCSCINMWKAMLSLLTRGLFDVTLFFYIFQLLLLINRCRGVDSVFGAEPTLQYSPLSTASSLSSFDITTLDDIRTTQSACFFNRCNGARLVMDENDSASHLLRGFPGQAGQAATPLSQKEGQELPFRQPILNAAVDKPLPPASAEQCAIARSIKAGLNVVVDAVAGSGKTTTLLHIAAASPEKRVLLLTYNARLKAETRCRAAGLKNLEAHSYHSLGYKYYSPDCRRDAGLRAAVEADARPTRALPPFGLVVLDEAQDATPLLFAFAAKALRDIRRRAGAPPQLLVVGDALQERERSGVMESD